MGSGNFSISIVFIDMFWFFYFGILPNWILKSPKVWSQNGEKLGKMPTMC